MALRPKRYSYLIDDGYFGNMPKATTKCAIKCYMKFRDCKNILKNNEKIVKSKQSFRIEACNVFTEKVNKIALSGSDDKRLQALGAVISYPYGAGAGKVCKGYLVEM